MTIDQRQSGKILDDLRAGRISRRAFMLRAAALGFSASAINAFLIACGGTATATPAPTARPSAVASTAASAAPAASAAASAASAAPAASAAASASGGAAAKLPEIKGNITLYHAYGTGSSEEAAMNTLIEAAKKANANAKITVLQIPFDQIFTKVQNEVASGAGPDLFVAPNDSLGDQVRAGLLKAIDDQFKPFAGDYLKGGIDGMMVAGKMYGVPESFKAVGLFYNTDKVKTVPKTTDDLLKAVKTDGLKLVLNQSAYHNFGWLQAFGGQLFDANYKCVADQAGGKEWLTFLKTLKAEKNVTFTTDGAQQDSLFKEAKADMTVNGPWASGDYVKALTKAKVGFAPMPGGAKPAGPLTGVDGFYITNTTKNLDGALALALYLTAPEAQKVFIEQAGHVPCNSKVQVTDPLVKGFADAAATGVARPQVPELSAFWENFGNAITKVLDANADPAQAIGDAVKAVNTANKK